MSKKTTKQLMDERDEYLNGWKRAQADYKNLKREMEDRHSKVSTVVMESMLVSLLPVLDNLQAAMAHAPDEPKEWISGIGHVERQFVEALKQFGVQLVAAEGEDFDPACMEAVEEQEGDEDGKVLEVLQAGYKMGDVCLRAAKVTVSKRLSS